MAFKSIVLPELGEIRLYKRKDTRNIRLSVGANGIIRVSLPPWVPYRMGIDFVTSKQEWLQSHVTSPIQLEDGQLIGKAHRITFINDPTKSKVGSRLRQTQIVITIPAGFTKSSPEVQEAASKVAKRALKQEAERLLPQRLRTLAEQHGFAFKSVGIKHLKGRWGSCDQQTNIVLNSYLMQLPWELIDYVLLHELTHTRIMAHGSRFWDEMRIHLPSVDERRKSIKQYKPILIPK